MSDFTCYEEVVRYGFAEPCDLPATGYATHPECERPYPACEHHRDKTPGRHTAALTYLLARRPELRDVGIAGYLVGAATNDDAILRRWTQTRVEGHVLATALMKHMARPLDMNVFRGEWTA